MSSPLEAAREASVRALFDAWTELRGYVGAAVEDGIPIDAARLAAYMDELRSKARAPLAAVINGMGR